MNYINYVLWKNWSWATSQSLQDWQRQLFSKELRKLPFAPQRILEIGYGSGEFMVFAREQGMDIHGIELIPELVQEANRHQFPAKSLDFTEEDIEHDNGEFDLVVMFDVIEHIPTQKADLFWKNIEKSLRSGGCVLCRFPNGNSPFSLPYQNGDLTHRVWWNSTSLKQQLLGTSLTLLHYNNAARVATGRLKVLKHLLFGVRSLIEMMVGLIYYGSRYPMDPNAVAILQKVKD